MRAILRIIVNSPLIVVLAVVLTGALGIYAVLHLPVELFPGMDVPLVNVISHYPGASPNEIELLVTRPIETRLRGVQGVKRVASTSVQGLSLISVEFAWGTPLVQARQLVQAAVVSVRSELPPGLTPRLENIGTTLQEVSGYVLYGGVDPVELRTLAAVDVAARLRAVDGVQRIEVVGGDSRAFVVTLNPTALARLHLNIAVVAARLRVANRSVAAGVLDRGRREYLIRGDARFRSIQDVRRMPLPTPGGGMVPLSAVAEIREGRAPRHYSVHGDGAPAVALLVQRQPGASTVHVARAVDRKIAELRRRLPPGVRLRKFYDQSELISEAGASLLEALWVSAALVTAVLFFFLGVFRATVVVAATIPLSLVATLGLMKTFGMSLNVVTMAALTLAVGMIVDDAIVVAENIFRRRQKGDSLDAAAVAGAAEIAAADASGTLTTVAAFFPLVLVGGLVGTFLKPFGLVVSSALLASLVVSLTFVPAVFSRGLPETAADAPGRRLLEGLRGVLRRALRRALAHRGRVVSAAGTALGLFLLAFTLGQPQPLPRIDEGALLIEYIMPPGTSLTESDRIGAMLERAALATPDVVCVYRRTGSPAAGIQVEGVNRGEITMKLKPRGERRRSAFQLLADFKKEFSKVPGVVFLFHQPTQEKMDESFSGLPAVFGVTVFGPDPKRLITLAARVEGVLVRDRAVSNVVNNTKIQAPQITVRPDPGALQRTGISAGELFRTLECARFGLEVTRIVRPREQVVVLLKVPAERPFTLERLRRLWVVADKGTAVPLEQVADIRVEGVPAEITHLNGQRQVTLMAEVEGSIPAAIARLRSALDSFEWPAGYSYEFTGQYRVLLQTARDMAFVLLSAAALVYLIMVAQFRSWTQPLAILLVLPFALLGAVIALALTRQSLDVSVAMGAITLAGIGVNNAIVLTDMANRLRRRGTRMTEALIQAADIRLRPVLMTALTTVFGLLPIALGRGVGSRIFQPFAIAVTGGLLTATLATLVLVPVLLSFVPGRGRN
ncbi:MAG: efflux RND transporter permease subunit [Kiritimatiellaeota bacterium]|nr:efflux RND transporter permease subunit [Kiritimatiellota bacterium]